MSRLPALVASLMLPLPLWAETCPVAADLTTGGIAFDVNGIDIEIFRQKRPGLIESFYAYEGDPGNGTRAMLAQGLYVLELVDLENGDITPDSRGVYSFPVAPSQLPLPDLQTSPGTEWTFTVAHNFSGDLGSETQVYTVMPKEEKSYGDCAYPMIPIQMRYTTDTGEEIEMLHFLPDLGISYLASVAYDGGEDIYDYQTIRALK